MDAQHAAADAARRKVKRAAGLLKDAARDLAAAADGQEALGVIRAHDAASTQAALELVRLGVGRHGGVDVIVIARPTGRAHPPRPPHRGEGAHHGPQDHPTR